MIPVIPNEIRIFYYYAPEDKALRDQLAVHLSPLKWRYPFLTEFHFHEILPGEDRKASINWHLEKSHLILLLISPDFVASNSWKELQKALERKKVGTYRVVPILLRPTYLEGAPFDSIQMLPTNTKPITLWPNRDDAFQNVVAGIHLAIGALLDSRKTKKEWVKEGRAYHKLGLYTEALAAFDQGLRLDSNFATAHNGKGDVLYDLRRYEEALVAYGQAIGLKPKYATAQCNKGDALYNLKRYEEAIAAYDQAIKLRPNFADAYAHKCYALNELKYYNEAKKAFDKAHQLGYNGSLPPLWNVSDIAFE